MEVGAEERHVGSMQGPAAGSMSMKAVNKGVSKKQREIEWENALILDEKAFVSRFSFNSVSQAKISSSADESSVQGNNSSSSSLFNVASVSSSITKNDIISLVMLRCIYETRAHEMILRLKAFWKATYNLTDERCQSFNPDEKILGSSNANMLVDKVKVNIKNI